MYNGLLPWALSAYRVIPARCVRICCAVTTEEKMVELTQDVQREVIHYRYLCEVLPELRQITQHVHAHLAHHSYQDPRIEYQKTGYCMLCRLVLLHCRAKRWRVTREVCHLT